MNNSSTKICSKYPNHIIKCLAFAVDHDILAASEQEAINQLKETAEKRACKYT